MPDEVTNKLINLSYFSLCIIISFWLIVFPNIVSGSQQDKPDISSKIIRLARGGSVGVWGDEGNCLFSLNLDKKMVPASILKILTASVFLNSVGSDFQFQTDFYLDDSNNLLVRGYGDPLMVSEEMAEMCKKLKQRGLEVINNIILDDTFFSSQLSIPGVGFSTNPYGAVNGALSVNFNTIYVTVSENGIITSAEPQTPLTEFTKKIARESGKLGTFRLSIKQNGHVRVELYYSLLRAFLEASAIKINGHAIKCQKVPATLKTFYRHGSRKSATDCIAAMMEYSNNFIANQLFLVTGARQYGPPATVVKAKKALLKFMKEELNLTDINIFEGSGISRQNKISANQFHVVLDYFKPYKHLLNYDSGIWSKTGTLKDVQSLAGYYLTSTIPDELRKFVIMLTGSNPNREEILQLLKQYY